MNSRAPLSLPARTVGCCLALGLLIAALLPVGATTLLRIDDLEQLVDESRSALLGRVVEVQYGYDERRLHSTWVTVEVEDAVYGDALPGKGETYTFKLYGSPMTMPDGSRVFIDGTPRYRRGDRFLLLLLKISDWGFTDTAGMFQGAFRITEDAQGLRMAESLAGNHNVLRAGGLGRWLDAEEVAAADRLFLGPVRGPVPYLLLRRAVARMKGAPELPLDPGPVDGKGGAR